MPVTAIRLQNFMGFVDTDWVELRPVTLLFGKNSTGKSAIIRALLLLKQSLDAPAVAGPLIFKHKDGVDLGSFHRMVRGRIDTEPGDESPRYMTFGFRCEAETEYLDTVFGAPLSADERESLSFVELHLSYYWNPEEKRVEFSTLAAEVRANLESEERQTLLEMMVVDQATEWYDARSFFLSAEELPPSLVRLKFERGFIPNISLDPAGTASDELSQQKNALQSIVHRAADEVRDFFRNLHYLGPMRSKPQRYYFPESVLGGWQSQEGMDVILDFLNHDDERTEALLSYWMKRLGLGERISKREIPLDLTDTEVGYEVQVEKEGETPLASLREVGYGASQVLPVVLKALFAPPGALVIVEQPEVHLHPAMQVELIDLFIRQAIAPSHDSDPIRFLLETHSEHMILRALKRIRHTTYEMVQPEADRLSERDINVLYVTQSAQGSTLQQPEVTPDGDFKEDWPEGFFNERGRELR